MARIRLPVREPCARQQGVRRRVFAHGQFDHHGQALEEQQCRLRVTNVSSRASTNPAPDPVATRNMHKEEAASAGRSMHVPEHGEGGKHHLARRTQCC